MRLWLPAQTNKKIGSGYGAALKVAAPGSSGFATLGVSERGMTLVSEWGIQDGSKCVRHATGK